MSFRRRRWGSYRGRGAYEFGSYEVHPKEPAPRDGVKASGSSSTWWGQQWIAALTRLGGLYSNRLPRGVVYAREGRVRDLRLTREGASAGVVGTRPSPYRVTIRLAAWTGPERERLLEALRSRARHVTALLSGRMPDALDPDVARLVFPRPGADLSTACSCPDDANPCKHVAAVHYVLAEALDRDPFLLFELRGLDRQDLLSALDLAPPTPPPPPGSASPRPPAPAPRDASGLPPTAREPTTWDTLLGDGTAHVELHFHLESPRTDALILEQLGQVPGGSEPRAWDLALAPIYRKVGEQALRLGLGQGAGAPGPSSGQAPVVVPAGGLHFLGPAPEKGEASRVTRGTRSRPGGPGGPRRRTARGRRLSRRAIADLKRKLDTARVTLIATLARLLGVGAA